MTDIQSIVGIAIAYSGDMANPPGRGAIVAVESDRWGEFVTIRLEDGREMRRTPISMLHTEPNGCAHRYVMQPTRHGAPYLAQLAAAVILRNANIKAADDERQRAFAAEVERIKAAHPDLEQGRYSEAAAKNIRRMLRAAFPKVRFSVTQARGYSGIRIRWANGPSIAEVRAITDRFEAGNFNGMTDCYECSRSPWNETFGSVEYINCYRDG